MRVTVRAWLVLVLVLALIAAGCNGSDTDPDPGPDTTETEPGPDTTEPDPSPDTTEPDLDPDPSAFVEDLDLLWTATFGDSELGSYSRYTGENETNWRSRYQYADMATMLPGSGVGDCGTDIFQPIGLFNLRQVYLFDRDGNPVDVSRGFARGEGNRPGDVFGPEGDREVRYGEQTLPVHVFEQPPATREEFISAAKELLRRAEANDVPGAQIVLDYVLSPTMFHGHGSEDPTPAAGDAVSESLRDAAEATADEAEGSTIWVIDYGLPVDALNTWPANIRGNPSQPRPPADRLTSQYAHGLMVASVAAQAAPSALIEVVDVAYDSGGNEIISVNSIDQGLLSTGILFDDEQKVNQNILNFSIGSYACAEVNGVDGSKLELNPNPRFNALLTILDPYLQRVPVVAAVGNDDTGELLYPAGFDGVIGVAAIDDTVPNTELCLDSDAGIYSWSPESAAPEGCVLPADREAPFNNTGEVDGFRAGVDLVVDYPTFDDTIGAVEYRYYGGDEQPNAGPRETLDTGRVRMSGTSLATPLYAACLAGSTNEDPVC